MDMRGSIEWEASYSRGRTRKPRFARAVRREPSLVSHSGWESGVVLGDEERLNKLKRGAGMGRTEEVSCVTFFWLLAPVYVSLTTSHGSLPTKSCKKLMTSHFFHFLNDEASCHSVPSKSLAPFSSPRDP